MSFSCYCLSGTIGEKKYETHFSPCKLMEFKFSICIFVLSLVFSSVLLKPRTKLDSYQHKHRQAACLKKSAILVLA